MPNPAIMAIVEEAINAGIEEVCLIVQSGDTELFESFFQTPPRIEHYNKLSKENQAYCDALLELGSRVSFVTQDVQEGFGHAVYCAREWVGNEPFLLMLGDHLYGSDEERCCARQVVEAYERVGHSVVGSESDTDRAVVELRLCHRRMERRELPTFADRDL